MQFPCRPAFSNSNPCRGRPDHGLGELRAGSFVCGSRTSSIASMAPSPRTSPIRGRSRCQPSIAARIVSPRPCARSTALRRRRRRGPPAPQRAHEVAYIGPPTAPSGGASMIAARAREHTRQGQPAGDRLATRTRSGSTSKCSSRTSGGCGRSRLHFVRDEADPVARRRSGATRGRRPAAPARSRLRPAAARRRSQQPGPVYDVRHEQLFQLRERRGRVRAP